LKCLPCFQLNVIYVSFLSIQIRVVNAFRSSVDNQSQRALTSPVVFNSLLAPVRTVMVPGNNSTGGARLDSVSEDDESTAKTGNMETPM
jgi:hypothetical protein